MGSCCNGKQVVGIRIEINPSKKVESLENQQSLAIIAEINEHYLIVPIWTSSELLFHALFPKSLVNICLTKTHSLRLSLVPYSSNISSIKDALLFISDNKADKSEVLKICLENPKICQKFLICPNQSIKIKNDVLATVLNADQFLSEFKIHYKALNLNLQEKFTDIDKDLDGLIGFNDLTTSNIKSQTTDSEIHKYFETVLGGVSEKMDLEKFICWWKRGRQGLVPFPLLIKSWLNRLEKYLPQIDRDFEKINIKKSIIRKMVSKKNAEPGKPDFELTISIGNSGKKEEILRKITETLNLHIYEFWVYFQVEYKSELQCKYCVNLYKDLIESLKIALIVNSSSADDIRKGVIGNAICEGNVVYFGFGFDVCNDAVEEALEFVEKLNELLKSPTDDFAELKVLSTGSVVNKKSSESLAESLRDSEVFIQAEHWDSFNEVVQERSFLGKILKTFLELNGDIQLENYSLAGVPSIRYLLDLLLTPIKSALKLTYSSSQILSQFGQDLYPNFTLSSRIGNYGVSLKLSDTNIKDLLTS